MGFRSGRGHVALLECQRRGRHSNLGPEARVGVGVLGLQGFGTVANRSEF